MKRCLVTIIALSCLFAVPSTSQGAPEAVSCEPETALSPQAAAALEQARSQFAHLAMLLNQVTDSESAARLAPQITATWNILMHFDTSVFDGEDEEMLAAECASMFDTMKNQLIRLFDANCYENALLKECFGVFTDVELPPAAEGTQPLSPAPELPAQEASSESPLPRAA